MGPIISSPVVAAMVTVMSGNDWPNWLSDVGVTTVMTSVVPWVLLYQRNTRSSGLTVSDVAAAPSVGRVPA